MGNKLSKEGIIDLAELEKSASFPSQKRLKRSAVAIIECLQEIPCNPCEFVCPEKAIEVGKPITNVPRFHEDRCTGCGVCIAHCPGLAIFVVDLAYSSEEAIVEFPYEFLPLLVVGAEVPAVNREGEVIASGIVKRVRNPEKFNRTPVISLIVPRDLAMEVRGMRASSAAKVSSLKLRLNDEAKIQGFQEPHQPLDKKPQTTAICRCEEVSESEIRKIVKEGTTTMREIRNRSRAGMGLCQGRICIKLTAQLISESTNLPYDRIKLPSVRPPVRPIDLGTLATGRADD